MEEQYRDYFGKPITKKKYKENMEYVKKTKKKRKEEERKRLQKKFHNDGPDGGQRLKNLIKKDETKEASDKSGKIFNYKKGEYKAKIRDLNPMADVDEDTSMKELMELFKKETDKRKNKKKIETQKYGRPKKKEELEAAKGSFIKKKKIGANDYRKGGYVLSTKDNRKTK